MKAIIILIIISVTGLVLLTVSSCTCNGTPHFKRGNGHITTEEKTVTPFTKISIEGVFPVVLSQNGDKEFVKVETDENLQSMVLVKNEGDKLVVSSSDKIFNDKAKVYINVKALTELDFKSVGNLNTANTLQTDSLVLTSQSVGKIEMDINARYIHANLEGVGSTTLTGKANEVRINNKSVGALYAGGLKAGTLMIHNTAIGITEVYADSAFYIRSSAVGSLTYSGPGELKELKSDGIGRVKKQ